MLSTYSSTALFDFPLHVLAIIFHVGVLGQVTVITKQHNSSLQIRLFRNQSMILSHNNIYCFLFPQCHSKQKSAVQSISTCPFNNQCYVLCYSSYWASPAQIVNTWDESAGCICSYLLVPNLYFWSVLKPFYIWYRLSLLKCMLQYVTM